MSKSDRPENRPPKSLEYIDILESIRTNDVAEVKCIMNSRIGTSRIDDLISVGFVTPAKVRSKPRPLRSKLSGLFMSGDNPYSITPDGLDYISAYYRG